MHPMHRPARNFFNKQLTTLPMNSYFYLDSNNQQHGPVGVDKFNECGIVRSTLVWCNGMDNWQPADSVGELREWFAREDARRAQTTPPQPPHQQPNPYAQQQNPYAQPQSPYKDQPQQPSYGQAYQQPPYGGNGAYAPGGQPYGAPMQPCPPTYLVWAILSTICCCVPLGVVAILKSMDVTKNYNRGLIDQALIASNDAKNWCIYSAIGGLIASAFSTIAVLLDN